MRFLVPLAVLCACPSVSALDFGITAASPSQADFHSVAQDLTAALDYKAIEPAAESGILGGADAFGSYAPTRDSGAWQRLTGHDVEGLSAVGLRAHANLQFGFDIGAFYGGLAGSSARMYGGDLRYAIFKGSIVAPTVAVRASYTGATGLQDLSYRSYGADISISKGFPFFAPYAGVGYVLSEVKADPQYGLGNEHPSAVKGFAGLRLSLGPLESGLEYERLGGNSVYNLRFGIAI